MLLLVPLKFLIVVRQHAGLLLDAELHGGAVGPACAVVNLLSGALIPLVYLPDWLATAAQWSPFAGLTSTPALIFIGQVDTGHALILIGVQLGWVLVLWFGARLVWRAALRRLTVNGG